MHLLIASIIQEKNPPFKTFILKKSKINSLVDFAQLAEADAYSVSLDSWQFEFRAFSNFLSCKAAEIARSQKLTSVKPKGAAVK